MTTVLILAGILTASLDAGGYLAQEASLRRSMLATTELSLAIRPLPFLEASLGYGVAGRKDSFSGMDFSSTYHRFPLRLGGHLPLDRVGLFAGIGPAMVGTRTRIRDAESLTESLNWSVALCVTARAEMPILVRDSGSRLLGRATFEVYRRGGRTDVTMMLGAGWRFEAAP